MLADALSGPRTASDADAIRAALARQPPEVAHHMSVDALLGASAIEQVDRQRSTLFAGQLLAQAQAEGAGGAPFIQTTT